jgi:hypothetical protein
MIKRLDRQIAKYACHRGRIAGHAAGTGGARCGKGGGLRCCDRSDFAVNVAVPVNSVAAVQPGDVLDCRHHHLAAWPEPAALPNTHPQQWAAVTECVITTATNGAALECSIEPT